ncbi:hypothetical protein OEZ85_011087 [Tetradesmus obliquus]|uniref:Uncharacterized protein n=1 Tax=Tetradesmus obliquus TaxID=3088 RepID=A0ABY8TTK0_TETOB|nr:hypothetical protein OEZ85_010971 [Tetradesmus obliquus]WIA10922.1 hypothetical protein OEZ85_011087 [Tetradesmus obliquus]
MLAQQQQQQLASIGGGHNAWGRVNSLLNTKEAVADALLQHLQHVHATLPKGSSVHFRLLPGRLNILLRAGSGRVAITQGGGKQFEARLSSDAGKLRQLLCEYAWSARTYTLEAIVKGRGVVVPASWVPNIKCKVAQALCPAALGPPPPDESDMIESGSNEVFLYTLTAAADEADDDAVLGCFCIGHEQVRAPEECDADSDEDDDDDDDDDGSCNEEEQGLQLQDFDELACMLELTPLLPQRQQTDSYHRYDALLSALSARHLQGCPVVCRVLDGHMLAALERSGSRVVSVLSPSWVTAHSSIVASIRPLPAADDVVVITSADEWFPGAHHVDPESDDVLATAASLSRRSKHVIITAALAARIQLGMLAHMFESVRIFEGLSFSDGYEAIVRASQA